MTGLIQNWNNKKSDQSDQLNQKRKKIKISKFILRECE